LSAKRALPENELILSRFVEKVVFETYNEEKLQLYIKLIDSLDDLTLYNLITNKDSAIFLSTDLQQIINDINKFIKDSFKI
jgi:succinate dehydrogenase flavin-adding protein (antitoxin of CptAB toxin-antitoxin module)